MKKVLLVAILVLASCDDPKKSSGGGVDCTATGCPVGQVCDAASRACLPEGTGCSPSCPAGYTCHPTLAACISDAVCDDASCLAGQWCDHYTKACSSAPYCPLGPTDCPPGWSCNGSGVCVDPLATACADVRDCPAGRLCSNSTSRCVEAISCSASFPCPRGTECLDGLCARLPAGECNRLVDCFTAGDRCTLGRCVGCATTGAACTGALEACDVATNTCRVCSSNAECPVGLVCTADGCAECGSDADCAGYPNRPVCVKEVGEGEAPAAGRCQECVDGVTPDTCAVGGCGSYGEYCVPDGLCTGDASCGGATPYCGAIPSGNQYCGRCATDAHCPAGQGCRFGECHVFPPGDRCGEPIDLGSLGARTDFVVKMAGFGWEEQGTYYGFQHDAFYRFTLAEESWVVIDGRPWGTPAWASGRFRLFAEGCTGRVGEHSFGVASYDPPYSTYYAAWTVHLPAGTWVLQVGGYAATEYAVAVERTVVALAEGLGCATPIPLVQSASGSSVTATTDGLLPTSGDACSGTIFVEPARTAVYSLDLAAPSYVALTATPLDAALWLDLDVKEDCSVEAPRTCSTAAGEAVTRTFEPMPAGLHYVVVDAERNTDGQFRLDAVVVPWSMNDLCADARPLAPGDPPPDLPNGTYVESGTVGPHTSTPTTPGTYCGALGGNDVFYTFTTTGDRKLDVSAVGDGTWRPGLSVRPACGAPSGAACVLATDAASAAVASIDILPAGTWVIQVASPTGTAGGPFTLQVSLSDPVYPVQLNDACANATVLAAGVSVTGDTRGVSDDVSGACGAEATGSGKDLAYAFTAPSRGAFRATVSTSPSTPGFKPAVRARADCGATSELTCDVASAPGQGAWLPTVYLEGGASVITWVDGADGTAGAFSLYPNFTPPPANDLCAAATVVGSTQNAMTINVQGTVEPAFADGICPGAEGADVFFEVLVPSGRWDATVTVDPINYFRAAVAHYASCGASCSSSAVASVAGANVTLGPVGLNGSGTFGVSSVDGVRGSFNLTITLQ